MLGQGANEIEIFVLVEIVVKLLALCGGLLPANLSVDLAPGPPVLSQALLEAGYFFVRPAMILCLRTGKKDRKEQKTSYMAPWKKFEGEIEARGRDRKREKETWVDMETKSKNRSKEVV